MFDEDFIEKLPNDPGVAGKRICDAFDDFNGSTEYDQQMFLYEEYLKAFAVIQAFSKAHGIEIEYPPLSDDIRGNITNIKNFFKDTRCVFDYDLEVCPFSSIPQG